jgi:hypothetical protein
MRYERADLWIGIAIVILGAAAMMGFAAATFAGHPEFGNFTDAGAIAGGLGRYVGRVPGTLFALALIDASIIGAAAVSLSSAYAIGDVLTLKHSLHRKATDAKGFYAVYAGLIVLAAVLVLTPGTPLGLLTNAVQSLAGVLLPSATVFLLLLCNDEAVLGPWVNGRWLNFFTGAVIAVLVTLSIILVAAVLFPDIEGGTITAILAGGTATALVVAAATWLLRPAPAAVVDRRDRATWRMPPLDTLPPGRIAGANRLWMAVLRLYLLGAGGLVLWRIITLALG